MTWTLYAARPLTIAELSTAMQLDSDNLSSGFESVEEARRSLETNLAGIFEIDHNEVKLAHPRLRDVLMTIGGDDSGYLWDKVRKSAHPIIATACLDHLCLPKVQEFLAPKAGQARELE